MERGDLRRLYVIGENPAQSEADAKHAHELLERARPHGGAGHLPHRRPPRWPTSCCRPRRAGARPRARSRTASGGCSGCARRSTRPARPATTSRSSASIAAPARPRLGLLLGRGRVERAAHPLAHARRHELRPARGARRASSGRAATRTIRAPSSCTPGCGRDPGPAGRRRRSASSSTSCRWTSSPRTSRCGSRPAGGSTPTTRACRAAATPRRCAGGETLDLSPEDCERLGRRARVSASGSPRDAVR